MATNNCLGSIGGFWRIYSVKPASSSSTYKRRWLHAKALEHLQLPRMKGGHSHGRGRQIGCLTGGGIFKSRSRRIGFRAGEGRVRVLVAKPPARTAQDQRLQRGRQDSRSASFFVGPVFYMTGR